jgi:hypothetical protein
MRDAYQAAADRLGKDVVPLAEVADEFKARHITGKSDPKEDARAKGQAWGHAMRLMRARKEGLPGLEISKRDDVDVMCPRRPRRATTADGQFEILDEIDGAAEADADAL